MSVEQIDFLISSGVTPVQAEIFTNEVPEPISRLMHGDAQWEGQSFEAHFSAFAGFCPTCQASENSEAFVLFFLNPAYKDPQHLRTIRYQSTRIGGAHAAAQWLHYELDIQSKEVNPNVGSLDNANCIAYD